MHNIQQVYIKQCHTYSCWDFFFLSLFFFLCNSDCVSSQPSPCVAISPPLLFPASGRWRPAWITGRRSPVLTFLAVRLALRLMREERVINAPGRAAPCVPASSLHGSHKSDEVKDQGSQQFLSWSSWEYRGQISGNIIDSILASALVSSSQQRGWLSKTWF